VEEAIYDAEAESRKCERPTAPTKDRGTHVTDASHVHAEARQSVTSTQTDASKSLTTAMLPSPSSSPQQVLTITTNISTPTKVSKAGLLPSTPPSQNASRSKRKSLPRNEAGPSKRRKSASLIQLSDEESESTDMDDFLSDSDVEMDSPTPRNRLHPHNQCAALLRPPHFVQKASGMRFYISWGSS